MSNTMIIGLTGPVAAGKNEIAKILRRRGFVIIEADELAHELYVPQSPVWQELVRAFGSKILMRGGKINRKKLGAIVFSDRKKLAELNRIVHPHLKKVIVQKIEELKGQNIVINAALPQLFEGLADEVWVAAASKEKRLKRLMKTGLSKAEATKRIHSQMSQKNYLKIADRVIRNEGKLSALRRLKF